MVTTAKKLRFDTKAVLNSIARGEEVLITYRGKAYANMIPINKTYDKKKTTGSLFGLWKNYEPVKNPQIFVRNLRKRRRNAID